MAKIKLHKFHMDLEGKYHVGTAALMGAAFFLRAAYYFGFTRPESAGVWNLLTFLILPMLLETAFMVMLRGIHLDLPGVYGIMGAVYCLLLILQSFQLGSVLRIVLAIFGFVICGGALVGVGWGVLSKSLGVTALLVTFGVRLLAFDLRLLLRLRLIALIREAAGLCGILALAMLCAGLVEKSKKVKK